MDRCGSPLTAKTGVRVPLGAPNRIKDLASILASLSNTRGRTCVWARLDG